MRGEIDSMRGEIKMNLGNGRWGEIERTLENSETGKGRGVLDLHKSGNELCLDLHKSDNELSLDLHKSGNELSLDLHINESPKWNSSLLDFYYCVLQQSEKEVTMKLVMSFSHLRVTV